METKIVIDANHLFVPVWEKTMSDLFGEAAQAEKIVPAATLRRLKELLVEIREKGEWTEDSYTDVFVALDSPPYDRKKILSTYKSNRQERPEEYRRAQDAFQQALAFEEGLRVVASPGAEADDVIATLVQQDEGSRWIIATRDKDLFQLVSRNVSVFSTASKTFFGPEEVKAKVGVYPESVNAYLSLVGDDSDCIPGISGIGPKNAAEIVNAHGPTVDDIIVTAKDPTSNMKEKHRAAILEHEEALILASTVIELQVVELDEREKQKKPGSAPPPKTEEPKLVATSRALTVSGSEVVMARSPSSERALAVKQEPRRSARIMSLDDVQALGAMANQLFKSGLYTRFRNPEGMFSVMATGYELGFAPISSLGYFHLVEGQVKMGAHMIIALARRSPECEFFECVAESDTAARYRVVKSNGFTAEFEYTLEDARRDCANWLKNNGKNQRAMIRKTAGSQAARLWFPAETNGLYSAEEMGMEVEE